MQFHLNGFRPGDPDFHDPDMRREKASDTLPETVDVLIVGCGPAGLTLAAQLSGFPEIKTRIIEQKSGPMEKGQADGISCRSMEMFQSFGFAERVKREAHWVNETTFWNPAADQAEHIARSGRVQDVEDGLSEMPHVILNQARVHDMYLEVMRNSPTRLEPDYSRRMLDLTVAPGSAEHPVAVKIERVDPDHAGQLETVRARYVVGCDGARSAVRKSIRRELRGDSANQAWGVMDVLAVTDFPDIRMKSVIQSCCEGNILIIPREGGYLVRIYVELDRLDEFERVRSRKITVDDLIESANRIFRPYVVEVKQVAWWSVYEIGQRLTDKFDDVEEQAIESCLPHVFITGDACHTHSPKAGQGMNVSMGDSFNLGWKLVSVLQRRCMPEILHSYSAERQTVAKELIDFDHEWAQIISAPPEELDRDFDADAPRLQKHFIEHGRYTAGVSVRYQPSTLTGQATWQHLAKGFEIGSRFHSAPVIRLADARRIHIGHTVKADSRWHLYLFFGAEDPATTDSRVRKLCDFLSSSPSSPLRKFTPPNADIDSVIDVRAVLQKGHREVAISDMPELLLPKKGRFGLVDYEKVFCPDLNRGDDIFALRGIDRDRGCNLIVRPDQYVANILPLEACNELAAFFDGFMLPQ